MTPSAKSPTHAEAKLTVEEIQAIYERGPNGIRRGEFNALVAAARRGIEAERQLIRELIEFIRIIPFHVGGGTTGSIANYLEEHFLPNPPASESGEREGERCPFCHELYEDIASCSCGGKGAPLLPAFERAATPSPAAPITFDAADWLEREAKWHFANYGEGNHIGQGLKQCAEAFRALTSPPNAAPDHPFEPGLIEHDRCEKCGTKHEGDEQPSPVASATDVVMSPSDPLVILAGIKQFGLAPDGSDLRDLATALTQLQQHNIKLVAHIEDLVSEADHFSAERDQLQREKERLDLIKSAFVAWQTGSHLIDAGGFTAFANVMFQRVPDEAHWQFAVYTKIRTALAQGGGNG